MSIKIKIKDIGEIIDLDKTSNTQRVAKSIAKKYKNLAREKSYVRPTTWENIDPPSEIIDENKNIINDIETIADLQPGRNAQIAAKKISEKYKKMRAKEKHRASSKTVELSRTSKTVELPTKTGRPKISSKNAAKRIQQKYKKYQEKETSQKCIKECFRAINWSSSLY